MRKKNYNMVEFKGRIVQLGFGAVGKSFFEKAFKEIKINLDDFYVISRNKLEYTIFLEMGGKVGNFITAEINRDTYQEVFSKYLNEGDFLIDFSDGVGTRDFVEWCANHNVMYLNTGETDWDDNWYSIFEENVKKNKLRDSLKNDKSKNKYPIVLQHGNNPGLVSYFVKAGIEHIIKTQFKNDKHLLKLLNENKFNELAKELDIKQIHVNDNDIQEIKDQYDEETLFSTWSVDSFFFEMLSEATANVGPHENIDYKDKCKMLDLINGFVEFNSLAINKKGKTIYPKGVFNAFLVPHEETITIAKSLELKKDNKVIYRPTVIFLYSPCDHSVKYIENAKVSDDQEMNVNMHDSKINSDIIIRGYKYPKNTQIVYKENIGHGTEYVGVLLLGSKFDPVWVGNRIKKHYLYKDKKSSYWQTPTITPVAISALAAACWMIKNKDRGGIYFPDDIVDYRNIIDFAEKYISKTLYKTFKRKTIESKLGINLDNLQLSDIVK